MKVLVILSLFVVTLFSSCHSSPFFVRYDHSTGGIQQITNVADTYKMNWILSSDSARYEWQKEHQTWGLGSFMVDGKKYTWATQSSFFLSGDTSVWTYVVEPLQVTVKRYPDGDAFCETYCWKNIATTEVKVTDCTVYTPFNDNYPDSHTCVTTRCNAHIWAQGGHAYVCAFRMGNQAPHLGLVVTQGALKGYGVHGKQERDNNQGAGSNARGVLSLIQEECCLQPGEQTTLAWKMFWHQGWDDFKKQAGKKGSIFVSGEKYVVSKGDTIRLTFQYVSEAPLSCKANGRDIPFAYRNGEVIVNYRAEALGDVQFSLLVSGREARARVLCQSDGRVLEQKRVDFIVRNQQMNNPSDLRDGAYMVYDNEGDSILLNIDNSVSPTDRDEGAERLAMGLVVARYLQKQDNDVYMNSLLRYYRFVRERLQDETYKTFSNATRTSRHRGYNYSFVAQFYLEMYRLTHGKQYLVDAYATMQRFYKEFQYGFYAIGIPVEGLLEALKHEGMNEEYQTMLSDYCLHAQTIINNGILYPPHEVNFEQTIVGPAAIFLMEMYKVTSRQTYLDEAVKHLNVLEAFSGFQPDYHLNEIAIRHWDGYWFGKKETYGDTFPHYWSALTAMAYKRYSECTGNTGYLQRAHNIVRNNLCLFFEDGKASCAYLYPYSVNDKHAEFYDPYANDQDWAMYFWQVIYQGDRKDVPLYKKADASVEERVADLLSRMNIREKILQLTQFIVGNNDNANNLGHAPETIPPELGSCIYMETDPKLRNRVQKQAMEKSRLGIPVLFGYDAIHGFRTIYPVGLAQACSWNPELVRCANRVLAQETYDAGVNWTFAPVLDVCRDPRWGRIAEGFGEDPYTQGIFAEAAVRGIQGDNLSDKHSIAACLKHYVGYGASQAGIDYAATEISRQTLWDTYLPPFEAGVKAGAATIMSGFNDISGIPASANYYTLTEVLRNRWGFQGFVVTDWDATKQLISQGAATDGKEAAALSVNAGVDMDMNDNLYNEHLEQLIEEGIVSMDRLDEAVARVLRVKFRLGLFESPYTEELPEEQRVLLPESRAVARQLSQESMVLLKNEGAVLPLNGQKKIAMVGPLADARKDLLGAWAAHGREEDVISMLAGLRQQLNGRAEVLYAKGCELDGDDTSGFAEALQIARQADVVMVCIGEHLYWSGENTSRSVIELPDVQYQLVREMKKAGKPLVLLLASGRPIGLGQIEPLCDAIIETWHSGIETGNALADILTGEVNPSGKLSVTFPYSSGQIPIFYNTRQSSRTFMGFYQDIPSKALYEFGHGLSYTSYVYGEIRSNKVRIGKDERLKVRVTVTNRGKYDGLETVHWFVTDPACRITRPVKELRYFEKKEIKRNATETFYFEIDPMRDLSYVDSDGQRFLDTGLYRISVKDKQLEIWIEE